jgi:hypothetical protein
MNVCPVMRRVSTSVDGILGWAGTGDMMGVGLAALALTNNGYPDMCWAAVGGALALVPSVQQCD